jgi:hypothetical protein
MPVTSEIMRPLIYAVLVGGAAAAVAAFWEIAFRGMMMPFLPGEWREEMGFAGETIQQIIFLFFAPLIIAIALFISSAVIHLMLILLGGTNRGYMATMRVNCYGETSSLAQMVPFAGYFFAVVWWVVLMIIGLAQVHRISHGKAAVAVLLPTVLCCGLCIGLIVLLISAGVFASLGLGGLR